MNTFFGSDLSQSILLLGIILICVRHSSLKVWILGILKRTTEYTAAKRPSKDIYQQILQWKLGHTRQ